MHVTTRIEGRKHEDLLKEKGFRGFPSLAFLDAEGTIVGQPQQRSVEGFTKTLTAIRALDDLTKRIEAGEEGLDAALLLAEHALGKVQGDDFQKRAAALTTVSDEQKKEIDGILLDAEVLKIARTGRGAGLEEAAQKLLALHEAGNIPTGQRAAGAFWGTLGQWAMQSRNPELARTAADGIAKTYAGETGAANYVKGFAERAENLASWKDLSTKVEGGDEACKADLAVVEYELGFLKPDAFTEQAKGLLEGATAEQKAKLDATLLKIEFLGHVTSVSRRDPSSMERAANALVEMLDAGKQPTGMTALRVYSVLARNGMMKKDVAMIERAAAGFESSDDPRAKKDATMLRDTAKKLKEEAAKEAAAAEEGGDGDK